MEKTRGRPQITIGLIDEPVATEYPDLASATIREIPGKLKGTCTRIETVACIHGTMVAGILCARRGSVAPAICPECTLLVLPIFAATGSNGHMAKATPQQMAGANVDVVHA